MKIKELFDNGENITIENYLAKCGVDDVEEYLKGCTLEDDKHYDNIDNIKEIIIGNKI